MKKIIPILLVLAMLIGCGSTNDITSKAQTITAEPTQATVVEAPDIVLDAVAKSNSDELKGDASILLSDEEIVISGEGATAQGSVVTISAAGEYTISGTLSNGQIIVDTDSSEKVKLVLNGVDITCQDAPPIYIINAQKKVVIELANDSINMVEDGAVYSDVSEDAPSAAIFSKEDLDIDGSGTLYVTGNYSKGIFSKDDLSIEGGTIIVSSVDDGIRGKDSIEMSGGTVTINAGADGFRTSNETDQEKGYIIISGGELYITAGQDGIQAVTDCTISNATISISCGGGSENSSQKSEDWGSWGGGKGGKGGYQSNTVSTSDATSAKGIKATGSLSILSGKISIDSSDDAIHSNDTITISGGEIFILSGDDGVHADANVIINAGVLTIDKSYEGIEALSIDILGGSISVVASDDGINAAGGNDGSSMGGRPGQNNFASSDSGLVTISGGEIVLSASGDGLDSNGNIVQTDGSVVVYGPTNSGNGPLDYNGSYTLTGGSLLAVGASGMAQKVSNCSQGQLAVTLNANAGSSIEIYNESGENILSFTTPKSMQCLVCSTPSIVAGQSYTLVLDGQQLGEITAQ